MHQPADGTSTSSNGANDTASLDQIIGEALQTERVNPGAAALIWRRALDLVPSDSPQYEQIYRRMGALAAGWTPNGSGQAPVQPPPVPPRVWTPGMQEIPRPGMQAVRPPDPLPVALAKTLGSMIVAAVVYYFYPFHDLTIAIGFVVLMLIHEMGHVLATWYYGMSASPPIFIPYLGALINLREPPPNALVESVIGIGGPMLGTFGAVMCYLAALAAHGEFQFHLLIVAQLAFMLNLFNLLPVPPLDGGRITAAVNPWIWVAGLAGLAVLIAQFILSIRQGGIFSLVILGLLLFYAFPRIRMTLRARGTKIPYYDISRSASWTMGILYVGLGLFLLFMVHQLHGVELLEQSLR
jgi:Zn-dependent protease